MVALWKRDATYPPMIAISVDFNKIAGRAAAGGMPKKAEFTNGDSMAVSKPTRHPHL